MPSPRIKISSSQRIIFLMNIRELLVQLLHSSPSHMETLSLMRIMEVINLQAIICMKAIPPYQRWCAWGFYRMVSQFGFRLCWAKLLPKPSCWSLYSISWFSSMLSGLVSDLLLLSSLSDFLEKFWFSLLIIIILFNYYKVFSLFQFVRDIIWYHSCYLLSRASFWFYTASVWTPWGVAACSPSGQASLPTRSCLLPVMLSQSTVTGALMMSERRLTLSAWLLRARLSFRGGTILSRTV